MKRFWDKVDVRGLDECWEWTACTNKDDYGIFQYQGRAVTAHRFSYWWTTLNWDMSSKDQINHECDNPKCVNPNHLNPGTQQSNSQDMVRRNRAAKGQQNGSSKLTEKDVRLIRNDPRSNEEIAKDYPVCASHIGKIKVRKLWKHVT